MKIVKKVATALTLIALISSTFVGCTTESTSSEESKVTSGEAAKSLDGGITNAADYPIVNQPITLKVAHWYASGAIQDYTVNKTLNAIQEKTGIKLDITAYSDTEKVNLMFVSGDYPDIAWRLDTNGTQKTDAIEAGDVYSIDDYMQYAPNYQKMFEKNPDIKLQCTYKDNKMYSFPYVYLDETSYNLRDQWYMNQQWLDELNLETPKTTEDFLNVMRAFRDNAGKGTIPKNVTPYYMRYGEAIGGQFDIYCTFGVYVQDGSYLILDPDSNKITSQAVNPKIKEPLKYLNTLYSEGLIKPEAFTDDWAAYAAATSSDPPMVGSFGAFTNANLTTNGKWYYPMAPVQSPSGDQPYIRKQTKGSTFPMNFMIFKNNKYPVASARLANYMAEPEISMSLEKGTEGVGWKMGSDGKPEIIPEAVAVNMSDEDKPLGNGGILILDDSMFTDPTRSIDGSRSWAYENIYKNFIPKVSYKLPNLPTGLLDTMDSTTVSDLKMQLDDNIKVTFANWITGKGDIDAEWDGFVKEMDDLGLQEYLALKQKELDAANALK